MGEVRKKELVDGWGEREWVLKKLVEKEIVER